MNKFASKTCFSIRQRPCSSWLALFLVVASMVVGAQVVHSQTFSKQWLKNNGSSADKVDLAIVGDGYTSSEQSKFMSDATSAINGMFTQEPYLSTESRFNVMAINVVSNVSGAAMSPSALIDNYFGSTFGYAGIDRLLVPTKDYNVAKVINANYPEADIVCIVVNTSKYGGSGGAYATFSTESSAIELLLHELGHSFPQLADEYWAGSQYATEKPNMTADGNPATNRWRQFLNTGGIGIYSHEEYPSYFRPHQNCKMRYLGSDFCLVCSTTTTTKIFSLSSTSAPGVPAGLAVVAVDTTAFTLSWKPSSTATSYTIGLLNGGAIVDQVNTTSTSYRLTGFKAGSTEYVAVRANNATGSSAYSTQLLVQLQVSSVGIPPVPRGIVSSRVTESSVSLSWLASQKATSYTVQFYENDAWSTRATAADTSCVIEGLQATTTYYARVCASNALGSSEYSDYITFVTSALEVPSIPSGLTISNLTPTSFVFSWNAMARATSYTVIVWDEATYQWQELATQPDTLVVLKDIKPGSTQYVTVRATNSSGTSKYSTYIPVNMPQLVTQVIVLHQGWNLISFTVSPLDNALDSVFKTCRGNVMVVKNNDSFFDTGKATGFNSLEMILPDNAYLVSMKQQDTLVVSGCQVPLTKLDLHQGWNMVGCPFATPTPVVEGLVKRDLVNMNGVRIVKNFDGFWKPNGTTNSFDVFEPGKGYFIYYKQ